MTFTQFQPLLEVAGMTSLESIASLDQLQALQQNILNGSVGVQLIAGDGYFSPCSPNNSSCRGRLFSPGNDLLRTPGRWGR